MSEFYDSANTINIINIALFGFLVSLTLFFGKKNIKHLEKLFYQYETTNTIQLRPIINVRYNGVSFEFPDKRKIVDGKEAFEHYERQKPKSVQVTVIFDIKNGGKMVARNLTVDWKVRVIKNITVEPLSEELIDFDLPPTDDERLVLVFKSVVFGDFFIEIKIKWEFGENNNGKIFQKMRINVEKNTISYFKRNVNLGY